MSILYNIYYFLNLNHSEAIVLYSIALIMIYAGIFNNKPILYFLILWKNFLTKDDMPILRVLMVISGILLILICITTQW